MKDELNVVCIVGLAYCGSTLLNLILDSHPDIFGGGELHWIIKRQHTKIGFNLECTHCGRSCPVWTERNFRIFSEEDFYSTLSGITRYRNIVDSSKNWSWFSRIIPLHSKTTHFFPVLLVKHPIRHLASLYHNATTSKTNPEFSNLNNAPNILLNYYSSILSELDEFSSTYPGTAPPLVIRYEDIVRNLEETITPILKYLELSFLPELHNFYTIPHHQLGGNVGTLYPAEKRWVFGKEPDKLRKKQYQSVKGLQIDNKYEKIFSEEDIVKLASHPAMLELNALLGFEATP